MPEIVKIDEFWYIITKTGLIQISKIEALEILSKKGEKHNG